MAAASNKVKLIVSYGGEIRRCPVSGKARYVGGENRLVKVGLSERLAGLRARLAALTGYSSGIRIRYAIVKEGLDALHDVESDGDLWSLLMMLHYRAAVNDDECRVRAFLLPAAAAAAALPPPVPCMRYSASAPALCSATTAPEVGHDDDVDVVASLSRARSDAAAYVAAASSSSATTTASGEASIQQAI